MSGKEEVSESLERQVLKDEQTEVGQRCLLAEEKVGKGLGWGWTCEILWEI